MFIPTTTRTASKCNTSESQVSSSEMGSFTSTTGQFLPESRTRGSKQLPRVGLSLAKKAPCFALEQSLAPAT